MRTTAWLFAVAALAIAASCGGEDHHPSGDDSDDGSGASVDPDAATSDPAESVAASDACDRIAQDWCYATVVCELDTPTPGQETMPPCKLAREAECLAHRSAPVPSQELDACLAAVAARECAATMRFPGECLVLWDTVPPDAGVQDAGVPDGGSVPDASADDPDASVDAGIDAGLPDAAAVDGQARR